MNSTTGNKVNYTLFGESHSDEMGIVINGIESGVKIDFDFIAKELKRRRPTSGGLTTTRVEKDEFKIVSGIFNGYTTGAPLTIIIPNENRISKDYEKTKDLMRPSHADYSANIKYKGFNDYRGGGHFSGRLTAPIVALGAIIKQILLSKGIEIVSHISNVGEIKDKSFKEFFNGSFDEDNLNEVVNKLKKNQSFFINDIYHEVEKYVLGLRENQDSVGGSVECIILGLEAGIGNPFFYSIESVLSKYIFSIPAIKALEFGEGIEMSTMKGSNANDEFYTKEGKVFTKNNNNGGINGGISNGMPILFKAFVKPTPSIGLEQNTFNVETKENTKIKINGRHDPAIVLRVCPVIEAITALALYDMIM